MHADLVSNPLLGPTLGSKVVHLSNLIVGVLSQVMVFIGVPLAATPLVAVPDVVGVGAIFQVVRVYALTVVALVAADLGPVPVPEKEGQAMSQDALLFAPKLPVPSDMQTACPFPATGLHLDGAGFNVALRERLNVHGASLPYLSS